jgi:hypothetical protein
MGLERQINAFVGYVRFLLNTEQKKSDFKPEDENRAISAKTNVRKFEISIYLCFLGLCKSRQLFVEDVR